MSALKRRPRRSRPVREDEVTGAAAVTLSYLAAKFEGDQEKAQRLVSVFGPALLLAGVTAVLRSSIAEEDRMAFLEQLADGAMPDELLEGFSVSVGRT